VSNVQLKKLKMQPPIPSKAKESWVKFLVKTGAPSAVHYCSLCEKRNPRYAATWKRSRTNMSEKNNRLVWCEFLM